MIGDKHVEEAVTLTGDDLRLWRASRDLLAACKVMRDRLTELANMEDCTWNDWPGSYTVDAAIARAEGQEATNG